MIPIQAHTFHAAFTQMRTLLLEAPEVRTQRWQGTDATKNPALRTHEAVNVTASIPLRGIEALSHWRRDIDPNLPWADDHFAERVGGEPLNPGEQWKNWPWASSADKFRDDKAQFNHTYMERLWPKWARTTEGGQLTRKIPNTVRGWPGDEPGEMPRLGASGQSYGDLEDLVELLAAEPDTRQAWIPLFFPEDTGFADGGRKPCTLGYQVLVRADGAHLYYPLRSCDLRRHWRDDAYLAVRLLLWIIDRCRERSEQAWKDVGPSTLTMHMTSLHVFKNDWIELKEGRGW